MTEATLFDWKARRSGASITLTHPGGTVTNIQTVEARNGKCIALHADGRTFDLSVSAPKKVRK